MGKPDAQPKAKKGGSALKKLKSTLKEAGVLGKHHKISKKKSATHRASALSARKEAVQTLRDLTSRQTNPFELQFTRTKHDVLNRKVKGAQGRPGAVRKRGEENRKKTLAVEMDRKRKESAFVDRRFGENDPSMSMEDKMLERFMKERSKRSDRGNLFNLEEEDDEELTHLGKSLSEDAFNDAGFMRVEDDEDSGQIDRNTVRYTHFGGFSDDEEVEGEDGKRKSKNEIMKEIIAKSKMHKRERQLQKEQDDELADALDAQLDDIRNLLVPSKTPPTERSTTTKSLTNEPSTDYADYDSFVRELAYERRAKPTDRMKTEEEIATEAKARLEKLERDRQRRMMGLPTEEEEHETRRKNDFAARKRVSQADDLGDDDYGKAVSVMLENEEEKPLTYRNGVLVNDQVFMSKKRKLEAASDDEDEDEDDEEESDADSEQSGDDDVNGSVESDREDDSDNDEEEDDDNETEEWQVEEIDEEFGEAHGDEDASQDEESEAEESAPTSLETNDAKPAQPRFKRNPDPSAASELPYTFKAPETHTEFLGLVKDRNPEDQATIIDRLRVLHHVSLGGNNRKTLETLLDILFEHLDYLCSQPTPSFKTIHHLSPHIISLSQQFASQSAEYFITTLTTLEKRLLKNLGSGKGSKAWPDLHALVLLKLVARIYSTSDLVHPVVTPAMILIGQYLALCPVVKGRDAAVGLFLCEVVYEYETLSKRYVPEVINFFGNLLSLLLPLEEHTTQAEFPTAPILEPNVTSLRIKDWSETLTPLSLASLCPQSEIHNLSLLNTSLHLLTRFAKLYTDTSTFSTIFSPFLPLLNRIPPSPLSTPAEKAINTIITISKTAPLKRRPLLLQKHKPIPIQTYVPKFDTHYSIDRKKRDPNRERAEKAKLKNEYKKEYKGAVRELRKDAAFVARKRLVETKQRDVEYKKKMDKIMGQLASQEGAMRGYEREMKKAKGKR
ncbi:uncharacterized protein SPPG_08777 [Spizellomyces punctatus DAOM BR117]|uniref:Nop14-like family protein n=1 Tax=Spizellomyces punctatus (strain DAOM BR117) TaxID=645134 RepID=A0A0L0H4D0_SPIPD|nr:uncharacterized protein SPPG_08777 [Spizellomyces punctatus DAOM BR117]KNC95834.1 hypothetical protein SPPG_08777 [Spizellomyces punctatus DAOM BR117]|eukprot:XP_016603874.1 hypothetical protein SPPG_08777 [Spizellomyces punctatus DAOM BR117]